MIYWNHIVKRGITSVRQKHLRRTDSSARRTQAPLPVGARRITYLNSTRGSDVAMPGTAITTPSMTMLITT
jgi:hypothetical protein